MELKNITIQGIKDNLVTTLDQILDQKYGERGAVKREQWEHEFEIFLVEVLLEKGS